MGQKIDDESYLPGRNSNIPVKNCKSLNLPKRSFITLDMLVLKVATSSGLVSSSLVANLHKKIWLDTIFLKSELLNTSSCSPLSIGCSPSCHRKRSIQPAGELKQCHNQIQPRLQFLRRLLQLMDWRQLKQFLRLSWTRTKGK